MATMSPILILLTMNGNVCVKEVMSMYAATSFPENGSKKLSGLTHKQRGPPVEYLKFLVRRTSKNTDEVDLGRQCSRDIECQRQDRQTPELTYIMNGMIAMEIQPERVASGGLCPIATLGQ